KGMNRDEVVDYMVARYGDFVVYNPPLKSSTFLLWFGPFVLLILILWMLYRQFRKPPVADEAEQQTAKKAKDLLSD
ncbi:MAG: cytochrome c-type biogenesis protein CcmH, partial [Gammaproteobacteria bacterium]|nr:cytochrome c-type biogenesis protein CcmH [Gammaproteobacteria bacterium]